LYHIREIKERGLTPSCPDFPVYLDSPLASAATKVYSSDLMEYLDEKTIALIKTGVQPLSFEGLRFIESSEDSKRLNDDRNPKVIISSSGMCDAGRIRHHLKHNLWRQECAVVFTGFQAQGTLGRIIVDGIASSVSLFGDEIAIRCRIHNFRSMSSHADREGLLKWIGSFELHSCEIYRIDSDEFCLLLDNADMISASGLADRIQDRFHESWELKFNGETTTVSCRVALCVIDGRLGFDSAENVLAIVDRTLDIAKLTNSIAAYDENLDMILKHDHALEVSLKNSVQNNMEGFDVYFQPIVNPKTEKWAGLEALCRWDSKEFGRIPPLIFIHIAEQIGVINKIGYWVLDTAIGVCSRLGLGRIEGFFLDVNLSVSQMSDETLINKVIMSLQKHQFPATCLSLEVTESQSLESSGYSHTTIERLKSLDIKITLDDFGTGYSNFNNLRNLPVRILKTEKQFIDNIVTDDYQKFLTKVLVDLAHEADMDLVSEGVETYDQMKELLKNGADYFQGYLFARPLTITELEKFVYKFNEPDEVLAKAKKELIAEKMEETE